ncbi:MAG TPA: zinc ribbon domain-containing protein [Firmicutes bacterium]|nr:zinc ribbon domain-containing protein [Candidatus Fermentithermobacillaceae bacterium]
MPIFEYKCRHCGKVFEYLIRQNEVPVCPECSSRDLTKLLSMFSSNVKTGSRGPSSSCTTCSGGACSTCRR